MKNEHGRLIWDSLIDIIKSSIDKLSSINTIARLLILLVLFFWKGRKPGIGQALSDDAMTSAVKTTID